MKTIFYILILSLGSWLHAQSTFSGTIVTKEANETIALPGANVYWNASTVGGVTDDTGNFTINTVPNTNTLIISYLGFSTDTLNVDLNKKLIHFMRPDASANLDEVTVSQRRKAIQKSYFEAQNMVTVNASELLKAACCNLSESFETNPSIDVNFADALTGTKQIRMLGLTSPYIMFTEENIPSVRGAAQAYGLTFTPGPWIESIQITKGAGSVVNGFESIAGQINTELLKPFNAKALFVNLFTSANGRREANAHYTTALNSKWHTGLFVHANQRRQKMDRNKDGFLDMPLSEQVNIFNRWQYTNPELGLVGFFNARIMNDEKQLGQTAFDPQANTTAYWGSLLDTQRWDTALKIGVVDPELPYRSFGFQAALSNHRQKAFFGTQRYDIDHRSGYVSLLYNSIIGNTNTTFKTGLNFTYDDYQERISTGIWKRTDRVAGAFFELSKNTEKMNWVGGVRIDQHNLMGTFVTPRLHLRYTPVPKSIFRVSAGMGRKAANIFAENQTQFGTNRELNIRANGGNFYGLQPERAVNYGLSWRQILLQGNQNADITFDYYITDFQNQVVVDWETPTQITFYNLEGKSSAKSFQAALDYAPNNNWAFRLAYKNYQVRTTYDSGEKQMPLQPKNRYFINAAWESSATTAGAQWRWDMTLHGVGSQRLVASLRDGAGQWAPAYGLLSSQLTRAFSSTFEVYTGMENMGDYRQINAIIAADKPFSGQFDSAQVYAPIFGRMLYAGLRWNL